MHGHDDEVRRGETVASQSGREDRLRIGRLRTGFLFREMDPTLSIEDEEGEYQNLRRGIKAEAMRFEMPTQLVWPRTLRLTDDDAKPGETASQDVATRAWNFTTALYHKAGGSPWRLAEVSPDTCFVGIAFYRESEGGNPRIRPHRFPARLDGLGIGVDVPRLR